MKKRQVEKISYDGLVVFTDGYAINDNEIMFLSIFGNKTAVRGLWSALMAGHWVQHARKGAMHANQANKWRVHTKILPSKIAQAILIPQQLQLIHGESDFLFISQDNDEEQFFLYLDKKSKIPLRSSWAKWLFQNALADSMLEAMVSFNLEAYYYRGNDDWLSQLVTRGIKQKVLI